MVAAAAMGAAIVSGIDSMTLVLPATRLRVGTIRAVSAGSFTVTG